VVFYITYGDGTECSKTSAHKIQKQGNNLKERIQHSKQAKIGNQEWSQYFCGCNEGIYKNVNYP
jgi:FPC/CPF motif-containing protein YcgG